jgi:hypothetical protein
MSINLGRFAAFDIRRITHIMVDKNYKYVHMEITAKNRPLKNL